MVMDPVGTAPRALKQDGRGVCPTFKATQCLAGFSFAGAAAGAAALSVAR